MQICEAKAAKRFVCIEHGTGITWYCILYAMPNAEQSRKELQAILADNGKSR